MAEVAVTAAASAVVAAAGSGLRAAIAGTGKGCWCLELSFVPSRRIQAAGDSRQPLEEPLHPWTDVLGESVSYPLSVLDQVVSMMQSDDSEARQGGDGGCLAKRMAPQPHIGTNRSAFRPHQQFFPGKWKARYVVSCLCVVELCGVVWCAVELRRDKTNK